MYDSKDIDHYKKKDFNWDYFTDKFCELIKENTIEGVYTNFSSNFSVSGKLAKSAA